MELGYRSEACVACDEGDVVAAVPASAPPDDEHDASSAHTAATRTRRLLWPRAIPVLTDIAAPPGSFYLSRSFPDDRPGTVTTAEGDPASGDVTSGADPGRTSGREIA